MAEKEAKVKVVTEPDLKGAEAIEDKINELKAQRLRMKIDADTSALNEVSSKLNETESKLEHLRQMRIQQNITVDDGQIEALESDVERLRQQKINLEIQVEEGKLEEVQSKKDAIEDDPIKINLDNQSAMQGIEQISQGFDRLKQGASGVGQQLGSVLESAGRMEQTEAFLSMNMGADKAKQKLEEIREVTDSLPGDDVALQNLLSQAAIQDANMGTEAFKQMGTAAADYMAAMENFGKTSKETQQDLMNYILAGNTAELQGSPILQDKIDKLKEGTTVQERSKLLAEALNEAHWGGITGIETYNVKMQKFTDMLERGKMNLGGMFQEGAKWGMDFLMQLDESTEGLVGMTIAAAGFAAPITDSLMGLGQMASGVRAIKDAADFTGITSKLGDLKTKLLDAGSAAKTAALNFLNFSRTLITNAIQAAKDAALALADLGKKVLEAGYNALKTVGMWIAEKAAKAASTLASYAMAAAQWVLNVAMDANPIVLVVLALIALAAALVWAYQNVDWFREMVDNAWATLQQFGQQVLDAVMPVVQALGDAFNSFTESLGLNTDNWMEALLGFILFIPQLPLVLGSMLLDAIMSALGFQGSFTDTMRNAAIDGVNGFISFVTNLPSRLWNLLLQALQGVYNFGANFISGLVSRAMAAVSGFANAVQGIPRAIQQCLDWAYNIIMSHPIVQAAIWLGQQIANGLSAIGLGQKSPGKIVKAIKQELVWSQEEMESSDLPKVSENLGANIASRFNPNLSTGNVLIASGAGRSGDTIINVYGDVDSDSRVKQIVEAVRMELEFDNKTAGRTV